MYLDLSAIERAWDEPSSTTRCYRPGDMLAGKYRLLSRLGEGGMGSVWRAHSTLLDTEVAVKVVRRSMMCQTARERLVREARAAAALVHPSIVRVLDVGTAADGEPFLVMQLLRGKTVRSFIDERGRIPAVTAVRLLLPIAAALAEVHDAGIIHRDIKPDNIILEETDGGYLSPKLVDFGIAKQSDHDTSVTQSGVVVGSPAYMSPEQARGVLDAQSDVWSLSVVLYEMICGKRPFEGAHQGDVLFSVFSRSPEPTHMQGAGDKWLWDILQRGLAKELHERWHTMRDLGRALAAWAVAHGATHDGELAPVPEEWLRQPVSVGPGTASRVEDLPPSDMASTGDQIRVIGAAPVAVPVTARGVAPVTASEVGAPVPKRRVSALGLGGAAAFVTGALAFFSLLPAGRVQGAVALTGEGGSAVALEAAPPPTVEPAAPVAAPELVAPSPTIKASAMRAPVRHEKRAPAPPRRLASEPLPLPSRPDF